MQNVVHSNSLNKKFSNRSHLASKWDILNRKRNNFRGRIFAKGGNYEEF